MIVDCVANTKRYTRVTFFCVFALMAILPRTLIAADSLTKLEMAGRYSDVELMVQERLRASVKPNTSLVAPLCSAFSKLKRYDKLFSCVDELEKLVQNGDFEIQTDAVFTFASDATPLPATLRAQAFLELGDYGRAITQARHALESVQDRMTTGQIWSPIKYQLVNIGTLGLAYGLAGDKVSAERQIKALNELPMPFIGSAIWSPLRANGRARIYMTLGQYDKALSDLEIGDNSFIWAVSNSTQFSGNDAANTFFLLPKYLMRGKCYLELGKLPEAKEALDFVLKNPRIQDFGELYWMALFERGRLSEMEKNNNDAIEYYKKSIDIIELQRASINTEASKIGFAGDKQDVYSRLVAQLITNDRTADAFGYVERSKARALVDILASKRDFASSAADPEKARLVLAQLDAADIASRMLPASVDSGSRAIRNLIEAARDIRQVAPELSTLVTVTSIPADEVKALIGPDEALVEYYYQGNELYAFVLRREALTAFRLNAEHLNDTVRDFRNALQDPRSTRWQKWASEIHKRLWQPLESALNVRNVIVVPHGALHYLPFNALRSEDGKLVIDRYALRFLPSASVIKFLRPRTESKEALLLALGNPDLGDIRLNLKFAEDEARAVAKLFPQSRVLLGKEASESNFKNAAAIFSRIHFATHGKFQADDPLNSGLYLAKDGENDGVLTVSELYSMRLDTDLVTLSACETGLGKIANGDDVVGLTRGFLYAGSRSIVASLWSVDDKATAELMGSFYENLLMLNKQDALREAQLKTRQDFPHPLFWAAFQLTGRAD